MSEFSVKLRTESSENNGTVYFLERFVEIVSTDGFNRQARVVYRSSDMTLRYNSTAEVFELLIGECRIPMRVPFAAKDETIDLILKWMKKDA